MTKRYFGCKHGDTLAEGAVNFIRIECTRAHAGCYADLEHGKVNVSQHANAHADNEHPTLIAIQAEHHLDPGPGDSLRLPGCRCHFFVKDGKAIHTAERGGAPFETIKLADCLE